MRHGRKGHLIEIQSQLMPATRHSVCLRVAHRDEAIAAGKALGFVTTSTVGDDAA
ncbi:MAG: hypothetical protein QOF67_1618 [Mycobacterium sp.]|jgi:hypothetical protein|nr:hypothetical protein [Mycobacterium sp.]